MPSRLDPFEPYLPPAFTRWIRRLYKRVKGLAGEGMASPTFAVQDIDRLRTLFTQTGAAPGTDWDHVRESHMPLPDWFRRGLDPWSAAYRQQQERLWQLVVGVDRPYDPDSDEVDVYSPDVDAVRQPAFYMRRDPQAIASASDHVIATGMFLKHCQLKAGEFALEYGAGFGQTALALARMGVKVDTVDVSRNFCKWVQEQANFFRVPMQAHHGRFGVNPRPGTRYQLIWFYESFHHCWDFDAVVPKLVDMLGEGGRVILGGEPVFEEENAAVPYPWGVRLHSEVAAVMRQTRWMELGFSEPFLFELFGRHGFTGQRIECAPSLYGRLYVFERAPRPVPGAVQLRWAADGQTVRTQVGRLAGAGIQSTQKEGFLCYGPYAAVEAGEWWALIELAEAPAAQGQVYVDVASCGGSQLHTARWLDLQGQSRLQVSFGLPDRREDLEIRVYANGSTQVSIKAVALARPGA